ncbi:MAG: hypothetical protein DME33_11945 [Verrucomicrobia bacterium]|nr:MAG: hypothetical protein DME33_11945 [Verrucomicrobiota bacterium]
MARFYKHVARPALKAAGESLAKRNDSRGVSLRAPALARGVCNRTVSGCGAAGTARQDIFIKFKNNVDTLWGI